MDIQSVTLRIIEAPLKQPFVNALGTLIERQAIIVEVKDKNGLSGWGEVVAFSSPWYTEETITTCYHMLKDFLIPALRVNVGHPDELQNIFSSIRGNHMAKSGLECAFWDLYSRQQRIPLAALYGGSREEIETGVVIASDNIKEALAQIETFQAEGYKRYKVKIHPHNAISYLSSIRQEFPNLPLMVDANSSFTMNDEALLQQLDRFDLMMIEQPLAHDDVLQHAILQKELSTPICLDESIHSLQDAKNAIHLQSCRIMSVKMGRVGGPRQAINIHNECLRHNILLWCGGMIEFGISKAHNIALASLEGFMIPSDISSSARFWAEDLLEQEIQVKNGKVKVPTVDGIGYDVNLDILKKLQIHEEEFILYSM